MRLPRRVASLTAGLGLLAGLGVSASCSVILDFPQCVEHTDCTNAQGVELECRNNQCVEPIDPSTIACSVDADCEATFDDTVICGVDDVCAALTTDRCELKIRPEGIPSSDIVYIGSILPRTGVYVDLGQTLENAVQLAVEDFSSVTSLPEGRRIGWVACDSQGRAQEAAAAAEELMAAGVTAVIGPGLSQETIDVANVTAPAGALLISPSASAQVLSQLNDDGLVWRTTGNDAVQAAGLAARLGSLEPAPERVFALVKDDLYGEGLLEALAPRLEGVLPDGGLGTAFYSDLSTFENTDDLRAEYGSRVAIAFERDPDVIVVLGSVEARELVLFYLEAWAGADPRPALPRFIVSNEAVSALEGIVNGVSDNFKASLMANLEGVTHLAIDPSNYEPFAIRYMIRFDADAGRDAGLAYDAAMTVMLAHSALPRQGNTGAQLAETLGRLADETAPAVSYSDGLSYIGAVQQALQAGDNVDLRGVSGELDFDLQSGDTLRDLTGWDVEPVSGTTRPILRARRRFDRSEEIWSDL